MLRVKRLHENEQGTKLNPLLYKVRWLKEVLLRELNQKRAKIHSGFYRNSFHLQIHKSHQQFIKSVPRYLLDAQKLNFLIAPIAWAILPIALLLDITLWFYQAICFPVWHIPKVKRGDFITIDRHRLAYLNWIEKLNCVYCGYFNGLAAYICEVAARTEQYWCPVKHKHEQNFPHSRNKNFVDYSDGEKFRRDLEMLRRKFDDIE
jgi:hypothetical protein